MTQTPIAPLTDEELEQWRRRAYEHPQRTDQKWDIDRRYIATIDHLKSSKQVTGEMREGLATIISRTRHNLFADEAVEAILAYLKEQGVVG